MYRLLAPALVIASLLACSSESTIGGKVTASDNAQPPELPATTQQDVIVQTTVPSVDVLYVVDNSCSMSDKQQKLSQNFPRFMQYFVDSGLDYHIAVTTTDMDGNSPGMRGTLRTVNGSKWIDNTNPNAVAAFTTMALVGDSGSATEKGRAATYTALELKRNTDNAGFVRDAAVQHIIFLTDELDQSASNPVSKQEFLNWMRGFKLIPEQTIAHSIVGPQGIGGGGLNCLADPGGDYLDYANATGGVKFNICAPAADWPGFLEELGFQASGLKREFFLSQLPVPSSIAVLVKQFDPDTAQPVELVFHQDPNGDARFKFTYDGQRNSVAFDQFLPDPFAEVSVTYDLLASTISVEEAL